uniref:Uncharacterized protein n=1 Tax=Chromera velia CCMP2878 TaxID=1169474 RepID=A0A0G4HGA2_9ALVE|eukprot:Cvel_27294.t1-p1 / transcript=Cvel_27294.t1 / gene=Cvel_27294 / organism=Chromera_velia_CCMP2878 / gene_product=hypothetical protein / transcript_product=hypothetical protein / location=Cvel_scaffold3383:8375-15200(-) / protein_length=810 / sequence_SO=supercontig / SO=protein_coding / is_pseudo=false
MCDTEKLRIHCRLTLPGFPVCVSHLLKNVACQTSPVCLQMLRFRTYVSIAPPDESAAEGSESQRAAGQRSTREKAEFVHPILLGDACFKLRDPRLSTLGAWALLSPQLERGGGEGEGSPERPKRSGTILLRLEETPQRSPQPEKGRSPDSLSKTAAVGLGASRGESTRQPGHFEPPPGTPQLPSAASERRDGESASVASKKGNRQPPTLPPSPPPDANQTLPSAPLSARSRRSTEGATAKHSAAPRRTLDEKAAGTRDLYKTLKQRHKGKGRQPHVFLPATAVPPAPVLADVPASSPKDQNAPLPLYLSPKQKGGLEKWLGDNQRGPCGGRCEAEYDDDRDYPDDPHEIDSDAEPFPPPQRRCLPKQTPWGLWKKTKGGCAKVAKSPPPPAERKGRHSRICRPAVSACTDAVPWKNNDHVMTLGSFRAPAHHSWEQSFRPEIHSTSQYTKARVKRDRMAKSLLFSGYRPVCALGDLCPGFCSPRPEDRDMDLGREGSPPRPCLHEDPSMYEKGHAAAHVAMASGLPRVLSPREKTAHPLDRRTCKAFETAQDPDGRVSPCVRERFGACMDLNVHVPTFSSRPQTPKSNKSGSHKSSPPLQKGTRLVPCPSNPSPLIPPSLGGSHAAHTDDHSVHFSVSGQQRNSHRGKERDKQREPPKRNSPNVKAHKGKGGTVLKAKPKQRSKSPVPKFLAQFAASPQINQQKTKNHGPHPVSGVSPQPHTRSPPVKPTIRKTARSPPERHSPPKHRESNGGSPHLSAAARKHFTGTAEISSPSRRSDPIPQFIYPPPTSSLQAHPRGSSRTPARRRGR